MDLAALVTSLIASLCCLETALCEDSWNSKDFRTESEQTLHIVFFSYKKLTRPPVPQVEVSVGVSLRHIRSLDVVKQELQAVYDVDLEWYDTRLMWEANTITNVIVNATSVWYPDIVYTNGVLPTQQLYTPDTVRIASDGKVWWNKKELVTTHCPTTPGDTVHMCNLEFGFKSNQKGDQDDRIFSMDSIVSTDDFSSWQWSIAGNASITTDNETVTVSLPLQQQQHDSHLSTEAGTSAATHAATSDTAARQQQSTTDTGRNAASLRRLDHLCAALVGVAVVITTRLWR